MKIGYLISAITITVLILIITFQNVPTKANFAIFFGASNMSMAMPVILISILGGAAGVLYTLAIHSAINKKEVELHDELDNQF